MEEENTLLAFRLFSLMLSSCQTYKTKTLNSDLTWKPSIQLIYYLVLDIKHEHFLARD